MKTHPLVILWIITCVAACDPKPKEGESGPASTESEPLPDDAYEDDVVHIPTEVSGSFLTCSYMAPKKSVQQQLSDKMRGIVDVGCSLVNADKPISGVGLDLEWQITHKNKLRTIATFPGGTKYHAVLKIPSALARQEIVVTIQGRIEKSYNLKTLKMPST